MPFDPSLPVNGSQVRAPELRGQFNGLKELMDAIPAGPPGNDGAPGAPGANGADGVHVIGVSDDGMGRAIVQMSDGTTYGPFIVGTGPPGQPGNEGIPGPQGVPGEQGIPGPQGEQGIPGDPGPTGNDGPQGLPGEAGSQGLQGLEGRHVVNVADNGNGQAIIQMSDGASYGPFTVATGPVGAQGSNGSDGSPGAQGPQGPPGEVTNQQLTDAIAGTPHNPSSIGAFGGSFSDPPTPAEMQAFAGYVESLRAGLIR